MYSRKQECGDEFDVANFALVAGGCFALGAGLMYVLDPDRGTKRRHMARDKMFSAVRQSGEGFSRSARYLSNRGYGLIADTRSRFTHEGPVADEKLTARVRSAMGRVVSHPSAVDVSARAGAVTLCGPILADEVDSLISTVRGVRGVKGIDDRLQVFQHPGDHPALQGGRRRPGPRSGLMQENWSPLTRVLVGFAGGALGCYAAVRRDWLGCALGLLGIGAATRSITNLPTRRLIGVGAGRRAVDVQKTININAPMDQVFGFFSNYEMFPMFMSNVREVRDKGNGVSHWTVAGPAGVPVQWTSILTEFAPHQVIAWKSLEGSVVDNAGIIKFQENPNGSTRVDIKLSYNPPAGALGHAIATLFGSDPKSEMDADLARVKTTLETCIPPRDAAQPIDQGQTMSLT